MPAAQRIRLTGASRKLASQGQRAMLLAEQRALAAVRGASVRAIDALIRAVDAAPTREAARRLILTHVRPTGDQLRRDIADAVLAARGDARAHAYERLLIEFHAASSRLPKRVSPPTRADAAEDAARADAVADSYAAAVRAGTIAATLAWSRRGDGSIARALRGAHDAQDHRLRRIAATEVAQAYNAEHNDASDAIARRVAGIAPFLVKVWDARLDAATCPRCDFMDGRWAVIGTSFAGGALPGEVHPFCRCTSVLLPVWAIKRALATAAQSAVAA